MCMRAQYTAVVEIHSLASKNYPNGVSHDCTMYGTAFVTIG